MNGFRYVRAHIFPDCNNNKSDRQKKHNYKLLKCTHIFQLPVTINLTTVIP